MDKHDFLEFRISKAIEASTSFVFFEKTKFKQYIHQHFHK